MIWTIVAVAVVIGLFLAFKPKPRSPRVRDPRHHAGLPSVAALTTADEVRSAALTAYDKIHAAAKGVGKDDAFAHQAGVLQALSTAEQAGRTLVGSGQRAALMEAAPFNKVEPAEGRKAVAEYLVWRSIPDEADENDFGPALHRFRDDILADAEANDDIIFGVLYSGKYEWQRWLAQDRDASAAEPLPRADLT